MSEEVKEYLTPEMEQLKKEFIKFLDENPLLVKTVFKYKKINTGYINEDLFFNFLGFKESEFIELLDTQSYRFIFQKLDEKYDFVKSKLNNFKKQLQNFSSDNLLIKMIKWQIDEKLIYLDIIYYGIKNELTKTWKYNYSEEESNDLIRKLDELNTKLYWLKTIEDKELLEKIYWKVYLAYYNSEFKNMVSSKELEVVKKFLEEVESFLDIGIKSIDEVQNILEIKLYEEKVNREIMNKTLPAEKVKKIFELVYEFYSKILGEDLGYQVIIDDINTVSVYWNVLKLKNQDYTIWHIIKLIAHEIEKHSLKYLNMKKNFGKIQDAGYQEMEESTAVMLENYILYGKLPLVSPIVPLTTAGEIFDNSQDLQLFISGYLKLIWMYKKNDEEKRFLRLKQFYLFDKAWVFRRWKIYSTWLEKVKDFIESWQTHKLFLWGFSYKTLKTIENIEQYVKNVVYPVLLAEIIKYILNNNLIDEIIKWKPIAIKKLIKFLEDKYSRIGLNIREEIKKINRLKRENKDKVLEIQKTTREILIEILKEMSSI